MLESPTLKRLLIIVVFVLSTGIYSIIFIPESLRNLMQMLGVGIILLVLILNLFSGDRFVYKLHFKKEIYLFLLSAFFSMFIAKEFHNQSFQITLVAQRYMYFFFFYFFLHSIKLDVKEIEKLILPFALIYVFIYLIQLLAFPTLIVDSRVELERGTVRIFIPGGGFLLLAYLMSLQKFLKSLEMKYGLYCFFLFIFAGILQGTRQSLASIVLLTVALIFFNKQVKSRAFIIFSAGIAGLALFFLFQDIFIELLAVTEREATSSRENIRIVAIRFFLTDFMPDKLAYIFGNGQDSTNSSFGIQVGFYKLLGLYQSDIGLIGDYSKFGILFVIAQLSIMGRIIFGKLPQEIEYFRYFFIARSLTMFTGAGVFSGASGIASIMIILYMVDLYKNKESNKQVKPILGEP